MNSLGCRKNQTQGITPDMRCTSGKWAEWTEPESSSIFLMVINHFLFLNIHVYSTYTFVEKGGRIKIVLGIYSGLPARIWDQSEMHSVLKTIPNFLLSLSLNNYFPLRITLSFGLTGKKKLAFFTPMWVFFVHNSCQEAFLHLDTNMSCRFKVQSLSDTCHVRSLEEVVLICADFRQGKKIGQKKNPQKKEVKDCVKEWLAAGVLSYLSL